MKRYALVDFVNSMKKTIVAQDRGPCVRSFLDFKPIDVIFTIFFFFLCKFKQFKYTFEFVHLYI